MAGIPRFRIPTREEMEKAEEQQAIMTGQLLMKNRMGQSTASIASTSTAPTTSASAVASGETTQSSPKKRMLSQKAMLSRQPLSACIPKAKSASVAKTSVSPEASENSEPTLVATGSASLSDIQKPPAPSQHTGVLSAAEKKSSAGLQKEESTVITRSGASSLPANMRPEGSSALRSQSVIQNQAASTAGSEQGKLSAREQDDVRADTLPTLAKLGKTNSLVVNPRQRGNPILKFVRNVPWEYGNIVPDYVMGQCNCAVFLSLRYHQLHPDYIHNRLKQLGRSFDLRVLLVQVDVKDPHHLLKELAKICILADCTLMLAFSAEEAGRYLETYKVYENKAAEAIMERSDPNFSVQLTECLTRVKSVNKTDCATLLATFGSLQGIMAASVEELSLCPGFGPQKAKRLYDVFREPFLVSKKQRTNPVD